MLAPALLPLARAKLPFALELLASTRGLQAWPPSWASKAPVALPWSLATKLGLGETIPTKTCVLALRRILTLASTSKAPLARPNLSSEMPGGQNVLWRQVEWEVPVPGNPGLASNKAGRGSCTLPPSLSPWEDEVLEKGPVQLGLLPGGLGEGRGRDAFPIREPLPAARTSDTLIPLPRPEPAAEPPGSPPGLVQEREGLEAASLLFHQASESGFVLTILVRPEVLGLPQHYWKTLPATQPAWGPALR